MIFFPFNILFLIVFVLCFVLPSILILCSHRSALKKRILWAILSFVSLSFPFLIALPFASMWPALFEPRGQGDAYGFIIAGILSFLMPWLTYNLYRYKNRKNLL
jgi:hypothetical protein